MGTNMEDRERGREREPRHLTYLNPLRVKIRLGAAEFFTTGSALFLVFLLLVLPTYPPTYPRYLSQKRAFL